MLGLIKKDLLMIKGNIKTLAIIFVVFTIMAINGNGNFAFIPAFMSVMIVMSTFSYDEYNKTDGFITSLPNGKKNAVKSKYISTLISKKFYIQHWDVLQQCLSYSLCYIQLFINMGLKKVELVYL